MGTMDYCSARFRSLVGIRYSWYVLHSIGIGIVFVLVLGSVGNLM
jgi:hypothetical protein